MNNPKIKFTIKNYGEITAELYPEHAPATVENFLKLVNEGFFEGLIFHRVINGFMQNKLRHTRGVLSMARTSAPNSASSQFFIMHKDAPHLDAQYAGFGKVVDGIEVVDAIANVKTTSYGWYDDVPMVPVVIEKVEVIEE